MQAGTFQRRSDEGHLWMIAALLSLVANLSLLAIVGVAALRIEGMRERTPAKPASSEEQVVTIHAVPGEEATVATGSARRRFARTSADQAGQPAENPAFVGERDTRSASDRTPFADAPPLPSQAGIEPRDEADIETTESDYQDGQLIPDNTSVPSPETAETAPAAALPEREAAPSVAAMAPPPREVLLEGPRPVDVQVPREAATGEDLKPTTKMPPRDAVDMPPTPAVAEQLKPAANDKPAFRGNQRKTAIVGSISRTGRSSLDVEDSPLGRYQAAISRAVELEWQRNCVRHRDFITPGFLTVRFFVETSGKVRSVQFVGDMETGEVQKGFTLNSIRDASIPPMPSALRREYQKEPLELIFRFYF